jgi:glycosyltransferase involved in cell wall biosynthesis
MTIPNVSAVVPNYNHPQYLRQGIDTVLAQSYRDFELILLDDGSTDQSRSILCEYADNPWVRIEFNEQNSGIRLYFSALELLHVL